MISLESAIGIVALPLLVVSVIFVRSRAKIMQQSMDESDVTPDSDLFLQEQYSYFDRIQFISIPGLMIDEESTLGSPLLNSENYPNLICEHFVLNSENIQLLFKFFNLTAELIDQYVWRIKINSIENLQTEYLDNNYQQWIDASKQENSMDEFGSLLTIQNFLKIHSMEEIYAAHRFKIIRPMP